MEVFMNQTIIFYHYKNDIYQKVELILKTFIILFNCFWYIFNNLP